MRFHDSGDEPSGFMKSLLFLWFLTYSAASGITGDVSRQRGQAIVWIVQILTISLVSDRLCSARRHRRGSTAAGKAIGVLVILDISMVSERFCSVGRHKGGFTAAGTSHWDLGIP